MGVGGSVDGWLCGDALNCRLGGVGELKWILRVGMNT